MTKAPASQESTLPPNKTPPAAKKPVRKEREQLRLPEIEPGQRPIADVDRKVRGGDA